MPVHLPHFKTRSFDPSQRSRIWQPIALAVLLIPFGVWRLSARQQGTWKEAALSKCRNILKPWSYSTAVKSGYPAPTVSMSWLHASVSGVVPTLADRETIRQAIDQLEGVQCKEEEIAALSVIPHLEARRENGALYLSGELSDQESLAQAAQILKGAEPTLILDISGVNLHRAVLPTAMPKRVQDAANSPLFAKVWKEVNFAWPTLEFDFSGRTPRVLGSFPDARMLATVLKAVKEARPDLKLDDRDVGIDQSLPAVDFAPPGGDGWLPPQWMKDPWEKWTVYPALNLTPEKSGLKLNGIISSPTLLNNVFSLLRRMRPDLDIVKGELQVLNGSLDKPMLLPSNLQKWTPPPWLQPLVDQLATIPKSPEST